MSDTRVTPIYLCPKVVTPPVIDGKLDDVAWEAAKPIVFVLSQTGEPAIMKTVARLCWDDDNLYIAYDCEDRDVWSTYMQRDDPIFNQEACEAFLSPTGDLTSYFEINVSPRNVIFDSTIFVPNHPTGKSDASWDCEGLRTAVQVDGTLESRSGSDKGWIAEMAIPFRGLGVPAPQPGEQWRGNLFRIERSPLEYQAWSPTLCSPVNFHVPERFGMIVFSDSGSRR